MVSATTVQTHVNAGLARAASFLGQAYTQYRPVDLLSPLDANAVVGTPMAAFDADPLFRFERPMRYGQPVVHVLVDPTGLAVGDYLSGPAGIFFIATLEVFKAPSAVRTEATLSLTRPVGGVLAGANPPGGDSQATEIVILQGWPASMLAAGTGGVNGLGLPGDLGMPNYEILLPATPGVEIRSSDILIDQNAVRHVVSGAESSPLGWRIHATQEAS